MKHLAYSRTLAALAALSLLGGCAEGWSTSQVSNQPSTAAARPPTPVDRIEITEGDIAGRPYKSLGEIAVTVNKVTIFNADPTREMVDRRLRERAAQLGADAVIQVRYGTVGIGLMSWGSLDGKGRAIAFD
jgi:hypothetical protein